MNVSSHFVGPAGGILMSLIAFSVVFLVVAGLMLIMMATKMLAGAVDGRSKPAPSSPSKAPVSAAPAPAAATAPGVGAQDDLDLVAVITAAVAACAGRPVSVRSVRPLQARSFGGAWRAMARVEGMEGLE